MNPRAGTVIKAWLKDDAAEFAEKFRVESVIRKHSAFVPFPVLVDGERVNTQPALWREPKFSVTKEQYDSFYKALTYDAKEPLDTLHLSVVRLCSLMPFCSRPIRRRIFLVLTANSGGLIFMPAACLSSTAQKSWCLNIWPSSKAWSTRKTCP